MLHFQARRYDNGDVVSITIDGERIRSVEPVEHDPDPSKWPLVAPGLFDLQINGHGGIWFSRERLTADDVLQIARAHFRFGITRLCPTLVTNSFEALAAGFTAIRAACEREPWLDKMVPGCHLEGPYISAEDGPRGAHPAEHVRPADWEEFRRLQDFSGDRICLVTLAPEVEGGLEFIRRAVGTGVTVAIGHTAAQPECIAAAVDAGARLSTHLGNAAHGTLRRHPNYIWEQLGHPGLWASIIADGHHLPPSVVRTIIRTKGVEQIILTSDAAGLAGCPTGVYDDGPVKVEILDDGRIVIAGQHQLLAGSTTLTDTCVANAMRYANVTLQDACDMAGGRPARLLGFEDIALKAHSRADLILFRFHGPGSHLQMETTIAAGKVRFGDLPLS